MLPTYYIPLFDMNKIVNKNNILSLDRENTIIVTCHTMFTDDFAESTNFSEGNYQLRLPIIA